MIKTFTPPITNSAKNSAKAPRLLTLGLVISLGISVLILLTSFSTYLLGALSLQQVRLGSAASVLLSYVLFYCWIQQRHAQAHQASSPPTTPLDSVAADEILVVYASQTGYAEQLAIQTLNSLQEGGMPSRLMSIQALTPAILGQAQKILFIASTTGEGDAPDSAAKFNRNVLHASLQQTPSLSHLQYAILALGDRHYQAFCAFGHQLDQWLRQQGAHSLFDLVEVDNCDDGALRHWQHHLGLLSGHTDLADWHQAEYESWTLSARHLLNAGSQGGAVYHLRLTPSVTNSNQSSQWQAGDIAEILPRRPDVKKSLPHREYSIASIPADGAVELIVRQMQQADGSLGLGSGWLTQYANIGDAIDLRLRTNRSFHPPSEDVPLILIGNGTGIAGLRAHLKQRAEKGIKRNWLFFGERERTCDFFCRAELEQWQVSGILNKLDLAFSRDQEQRIYVQDKLREQANELRNWIAQGAAIYVCGSLTGMAGGVDLALHEILGEVELERLREHGLYRRDVY